MQFSTQVQACAILESAKLPHVVGLTDAENDIDTHSTSSELDAKQTASGHLRRGMSVIVKREECESKTANALKTLSSQLGQNKRGNWLLLLAEKLEAVKEPERSGHLYNITVSKIFDRTTAVVILFNAYFVAVTSDWEIAHIGEDPPLGMQCIELAFLAYYCIELSLKFAVHKLFFFFNDDMQWNIFDLVLVLLSIQDMLMFYLSIDASSSGNVSFMRILRLAKLAKILRAVRAFRIFRELHQVFETCRRTMTSLLWALVLLAFSLYVFALIIVQGIVTLLAAEDGKANQDIAQAALMYFGSVWLTILNLTWR